MGAAAATVRPIAIREYLSDPAYERYEWIDGRPVELNVGSGPHSRIQVNLGGFFWSYFRKYGGGCAAAELRCRLTVAGRTRYYLPDVSVVLGDRSRLDGRYLDGSPDLVIEIRSPEDSIAMLTRKIQNYFDNGAKLAWLALPEERSVLVFAPKSVPRTYTAGQTLDGGKLLPGLKIPVDELFA
jgi:Uma2 family endonuclease